MDQERTIRSSINASVRHDGWFRLPRRTTDRK
jgi:hypothetical protein